MDDGEAPLIFLLPLRAVRGCLLGALLGGALLAIGLMRFCAAGGSVAEGPTRSAADTRLALYYVGGSALAGALAEVVQPLVPGRAGAYVRYGLAGVVVVLMVSVGERGSFAALEVRDWVISLLLGAFFGGVFARGSGRGAGDGPPDPPAA
jgi:hypothetical protein